MIAYPLVDTAGGSRAGRERIEALLRVEDASAVHPFEGCPPVGNRTIGIETMFPAVEPWADLVGGVCPAGRTRYAEDWIERRPRRKAPATALVDRTDGLVKRSQVGRSLSISRPDDIRGVTRNRQHRNGITLVAEIGPHTTRRVAQLDDPTTRFEHIVNLPLDGGVQAGRGSLVLGRRLEDPPWRVEHYCLEDL